ncbi:MAG: hypothetical protein HFF18_09300 [Oscillospiraceae bacterium]|nr:hypothetical protein [Oscillospiraceae bacterium]
MDAIPLQVQMLGGFSIRRDGAVLNIGGRSRKLCLLLAYLIWERARPVSYEELTGLLWEGEAQGPNPLNALKAVLHRVRTCLDQLWDNAGRVLILNREGCYQWNMDIPLTLDVERFAALCQEGDPVRQEERLLSQRLSALSLYQGDFLPALSGCAWADGQREGLRRRYLKHTLELLPLLGAQGRWQETERLARTAFALEPCLEDLCLWQMEALIHLGRREESTQLYEDFQERLLSKLGVLPSDQLRELYHGARRERDPRTVSPVTLLERLREAPKPGALMCDYDFFRVVCHSSARRAGRNGEPLHVALISIAEDGDLPRHSLDRAMDNLQGVILGNLRRGDAAARCSASQFVLLLPQASYENGQMVCSRITRAFARQFPHSPASLQVSIQPLLTNS